MTISFCYLYILKNKKFYMDNPLIAKVKQKGFFSSKYLKENSISLSVIALNRSKSVSFILQQFLFIFSGMVSEYSGPPDPLHGNTPYVMVRKVAQVIVGYGYTNTKFSCIIVVHGCWAVVWYQLQWSLMYIFICVIWINLVCLHCVLIWGLSSVCLH